MMTPCRLRRRSEKLAALWWITPEGLRKSINETKASNDCCYFLLARLRRPPAAESGRFAADCNARSLGYLCCGLDFDAFHWSTRRQRWLKTEAAHQDSDASMRPVSAVSFSEKSCRQDEWGMWPNI